MILFNTNKKRKVVKDFFIYVEIEILPNIIKPEIIKDLKYHLTAGFALIERNEFVIAFENLASVLVEYYVILDREGISLVRKVIELCNIDPKWEFDLHRILSSGYEQGSWTLRDAEQAAKNNKYTFYKPSKEITKNLNPGNLVKLIFEFKSVNDEHPSGERMWVVITEIEGENFKGYLDNHPFYIDDLYAGDKIIFEHKHIIDHDLEMSEPNLVDKYSDRCIVTRKILYENAPINLIYREEPEPTKNDNEYVDTGWRIFTGDESAEYLDNTENACFVSLGAVLSRDDSFISFLDSEIGSKFERNIDGSFEKVVD